MVHGGIATRASCVTMERTITQWLAMKYNFVGVDENGHSEYEVRPEKWAKGDLDYVLRWNRYYHQADHDRTMHELGRFVAEARERKIDTLVMNAIFPIHRPIPWWLKLLGVGGGIFAVRWMLSPPKDVMATPSINTKPIEDAFQRLAGMEPAKETITLEAMQMPEPPAESKKKDAA